MVERMVIKKIINQYKTWGISTATKNIIYYFLTREKKKSFGVKNADKTFYVIRSIDSKSKFYTGAIHNLLANYFYVASHLFYAQSRGWVPIIDQLNYPVYNSAATPINGAMNPWEYFWQQPCAVTLEEVYQSKHVVLSKRSWFSEWNLEYSVEKHMDPLLLTQFYQVAQTAPYRASVQEHIDSVVQEHFPVAKKILGVSFRYGGHAKSSLHYGPGHPIQPEISELVATVQQRITTWGMDRVFLASDENDAVQRFREAFGDKLIVLERNRCEAGKAYDSKAPNPMYLPKQLYRTTLDYLAEMELLAHCDALIGSITSGLRYAIVKNGGAYERLEILDFGRFPDQRRHTCDAKPRKGEK